MKRLLLALLATSTVVPLAGEVPFSEGAVVLGDEYAFGAAELVVGVTCLGVLGVGLWWMSSGRASQKASVKSGGGGGSAGSRGGASSGGAVGGGSVGSRGGASSGGAVGGGSRSSLSGVRSRSSVPDKTSRIGLGGGAGGYSSLPNLLPAVGGRSHGFENCTDYLQPGDYRFENCTDNLQPADYRPAPSPHPTVSNKHPTLLGPEGLLSLVMSEATDGTDTLESVVRKTMGIKGSGWSSQELHTCDKIATFLGVTEDVNGDLSNGEWTNTDRWGYDRWDYKSEYDRAVQDYLRSTPRSPVATCKLTQILQESGFGTIHYGGDTVHYAGAPFASQGLGMTLRNFQRIYTDPLLAVAFCRTLGQTNPNIAKEALKVVDLLVQETGYGRADEGDVSVWGTEAEKLEELKAHLKIAETQGLAALLAKWSSYTYTSSELMGWRTYVRGVVRSKLGLEELETTIPVAEDRAVEQVMRSIRNVLRNPSVWKFSFLVTHQELEDWYKTVADVQKVVKQNIASLVQCINHDAELRAGTGEESKIFKPNGYINHDAELRAGTGEESKIFNPSWARSSTKNLFLAPFEPNRFDDTINLAIDQTALFTRLQDRIGRQRTRREPVAEESAAEKPVAKEQATSAFMLKLRKAGIELNHLKSLLQQLETFQTKHREEFKECKELYAASASQQHDATVYLDALGQSIFQNLMGGVESKVDNACAELNDWVKDCEDYQQTLAKLDNACAELDDWVKDCEDYQQTLAKWEECTPAGVDLRVEECKQLHDQYQGFLSEDELTAEAVKSFVEKYDRLRQVVRSLLLYPRPLGKPTPCPKKYLIQVGCAYWSLKNDEVAQGEGAWCRQGSDGVKRDYPPIFDMGVALTEYDHGWCALPGTTAQDVVRDLHALCSGDCLEILAVSETACLDKCKLYHLSESCTGWYDKTKLTKELRSASREQLPHLLGLPKKEENPWRRTSVAPDDALGVLAGETTDASTLKYIRDEQERRSALLASAKEWKRWKDAQAECQRWTTEKQKKCAQSSNSVVQAFEEKKQAICKALNTLWVADDLWTLLRERVQSINASDTKLQETFCAMLDECKRDWPKVASVIGQR